VCGGGGKETELGEESNVSPGSGWEVGSNGNGGRCLERGRRCRAGCGG